MLQDRLFDQNGINSTPRQRLRTKEIDNIIYKLLFFSKYEKRKPQQPFPIYHHVEIYFVSFARKLNSFSLSSSE